MYFRQDKCKKKKKRNSFLPAQGLLIEITVLQIGQTSVCWSDPLQWQKSFSQNWLMDMIYKAVERKKKNWAKMDKRTYNTHNTVEKAWKYLYRIKCWILSNIHIHLCLETNTCLINLLNEATQQQI